VTLETPDGYYWTCTGHGKCSKTIKSKTKREMEKRAIEHLNTHTVISAFWESDLVEKNDAEIIDCPPFAVKLFYKWLTERYVLVKKVGK